MGGFVALNLHNSVCCVNSS